MLFVTDRVLRYCKEDEQRIEPLFAVIIVAQTRVNLNVNDFLAGPEESVKNVQKLGSMNQWRKMKIKVQLFYM